MEANEAADTITEAGEGRRTATDERARAREEAAERFRRRVAVLIGLLAALLAITALGADQARETATAARHAIQARIAAYTKTIARYEDDPTAGGQGKKQLLEQARHYEEERDRAERQLPSFNDAQALFQIAIVLGSVSIVASSRSLVLVAGALGLVAVVLMLNGYLIHARLPLG